MNVQTPLGIGLLSVVLALILRECGFKGAKLFSAVASLSVMLSLSEGLRELAALLNDSATLVGISEGAGAVMQIIGISYIFGFASQTCRELGETGIASAMLVAGRVEIFMVGAPYLSGLLSLAARLLGGA